ncbi:hypothetical protein [Enterococcus faecium]|uniref:hypothetical protein n=1 Tax=Enterococcus faecium TaxID=1352 RepID=UPI000F4EF4A9|nr:hypothetical protein [Enterococcus faecium]EGO9939475.1 hypothetical protein [Enterococcus faecium]ROY11172.1 hypothetical protein EGW55_11155 [Enterococcus faecium]
MTVESLSLIKLIDETMINKIGLTISDPVISYLDENDNIKYLKMPEDFDGNIQMNEIDSSWSPEENNLIIEQDFHIDLPYYLFGEEGVTSQKNKLGLAVHYYSKTSSFQKTEMVGVIEYKDESTTIHFKKTFSAETLRGLIYFEFFVFLKENNKQLPFQAEIVGTDVTRQPLDAYTLLVDGDGSTFPIEEINEKGQPLWKLEMNWIDVFTDMFDYSNLRLLLNKQHPLYESLYVNNRKVNEYLMNEIIISAMSMIVQKVILIDNERINDEMNATPGSIAQAVWYWMSSFNLEVGSLEEINASFHRFADPYVGGDADA